MPKICDNKSVGMIVENSKGEIAIIFRINFPQMYACPAGHVDDNFSSPYEAAVGELGEEIGVFGANPILVLEKEYQNPCRCEGGTHHFWSVFKINYDGNLLAGSDAKNVGWKSRDEIKELIQRTKDYRSGKLAEEEWSKNPGFEDVWIDIFEDLKIF